MFQNDSLLNASFLILFLSIQGDRSLSIYGWVKENNGVFQKDLFQLNSYCLPTTGSQIKRLAKCLYINIWYAVYSSQLVSQIPVGIKTRLVNVIKTYIILCFSFSLCLYFALQALTLSRKEKKQQTTNNKQTSYEIV